MTLGMEETRLEHWRLLIVRRDGEEILLKADGARLELPKCQSPRTRELRRISTERPNENWDYTSFACTKSGPPTRRCQDTPSTTPLLVFVLKRPFPQARIGPLFGR